MVTSQTADYVLGIDYGIARTGIALGNTITNIAHPLHTLITKTEEDRITKIADLISKWNIKKIIIGMPSLREYSNTNKQLIKRIQKFVSILQQKFQIKTAIINEDFSSCEARLSLNEQNISGYNQKQYIDSIAACIILQQYFDEMQ